MRLPRDGRVSSPRRQFLSPARRPGSRKRHQVRRSRLNPRRCLHLGCVLPRTRLRLKKWRLAPPARRQRSLRLKGRKERLRLRLKRSLSQPRRCGRRKLRLLLRQRSLPGTRTLPPKTEAAPAAPSQTQPPESALPPPKGEAAPSPAPAPKAQPPESAAPPSKAPRAKSAPLPKAPKSAPPPAPSPPPIQHIVLAFERKNGEAVLAADVVQAEGSLNIEGAPLQAASEGLTADLPAEAAKRLADNAYLKKLLRRHQLVTVRKEPERLVLVVEPLYVRAEDLKIEIHDAAAEPVHGCELALDVSADRRLGGGWSKLGEKDRLHGLEFTGTDSQYTLNLPTDIEPNELLISTAEPGNVARLSSTSSACQLEARQWITAEELRTGKPVVRSLKGAGQTLIAVLSTDSSFAGSVGGAAAAEGFWSDTLRLVNVVSTAAWEKKFSPAPKRLGSAPRRASFRWKGKAARLPEMAGAGAC